MSIRKIATAAIASGALSFGIGPIAPAHAVSKPSPDGYCKALHNGHSLCIIWQYQCPGEPPPPLSQGAIQPCKNPKHEPRKVWRVIYY